MNDCYRPRILDVALVPFPGGCFPPRQPPIVAAEPSIDPFEWIVPVAYKPR